MSKKLDYLFTKYSSQTEKTDEQPMIFSAKDDCTDDCCEAVCCGIGWGCCDSICDSM